MLSVRKGVCAVVYSKRGKRQEFLLLHRVLHWKGWEFPKGGCKTGEKLEQALFRELKEEIGISRTQILRFKKLPFLQEFDDFFRMKRHKNKAFIIELSPNAKVCVFKDPDREHSSFRWLSAKKALGLLTFADQKAIFRKALKFID